MTTEPPPQQPEDTIDDGAMVAAAPAGKDWPMPKDRHTRRGTFGRTVNRGRGARRRALPLPVHPAVRP
jgi:hypothetical protein